MESSASASMVHVPPAELSGREWARLMWGFYWRNGLYAGCAGAATVLITLPIGVFVGLIMTARGGSRDQIAMMFRILATVIGPLVTFAGLRLLLPRLLNARYGSIGLAIVRTDARQIQDLSVSH